MNVYETSEIRELIVSEQDQVSGGFGALMAVTWMGCFFDAAKDAFIYSASVSEHWD
jgi:hypothetical protein